MRRDDASGEGAGDRGGAPAWVRVVPPGEAGEELAEAYRSAGPGRGVANILALHSLHPRALTAHDDLYRTLMHGPSPLSRAERESVAVVVSAANDCFY